MKSLQNLGVKPNLRIGSTDANIPLSKGLQSVCVGITHGGGAHTLQEFIMAEPIAPGLQHVEDMVLGIWDLPAHSI